MTFDPTKPCVTKGSRTKVEIVAVLPIDAEHQQAIVGLFYGEGNDRLPEIMTWQRDGTFGWIKEGSDCLDLINVAAAKYVVEGEYVYDSKTHRTFASAGSSEAASLIASALNAYDPS